MRRVESELIPYTRSNSRGGSVMRYCRDTNPTLTSTLEVGMCTKSPSRVPRSWECNCMLPWVPHSTPEGEVWFLCPLLPSWYRRQWEWYWEQAHLPSSYLIHMVGWKSTPLRQSKRSKLTSHTLFYYRGWDLIPIPLYITVEEGL